MSEPTACPACAISRGEHRPPGGVLLETPEFIVHGFDGQSPLAGWTVLTSRVHARAWYALDEPALATLGPLAGRVMRAQLEHLGAERVYALALGDVLPHFHLHLVPRYADTPPRLRGRGAFDSHPSDALPPDTLDAAAAKLRAALGAEAPGQR